MLIPLFIVSDIRRSVDFYTQVLDFTLGAVMTPEQPFFAILMRGEDELFLNLPTRRAPGGQSAAVVCDDVDGLFARFANRGYTPPADKPDSPVHAAPLDQTWGTREVYIDDPDGNTLCFQQR